MQYSSNNNISYSPHTTRKTPGNLIKHSGPPVGHSSHNLDALDPSCSQPAPNFGFFKKPETHPGVIRPAYASPHIYRSARNLSEKQKEQNNKNARNSKPSYKSETHLSTSTLPRMRRDLNQNSPSREVFHNARHSCKIFVSKII